MLLALLLLPILASANPFHKYPYVFLLDVGNEELEKVNTEQIRLSSPGGSVALRYPAIGNGDDIAHVRVSGIDFGTDLKANIVDGGPGYKYVVIVLLGNSGVEYDAVITIQTVPSDVNYSSQTIEDNSIGSRDEDESNQVSEDDQNNSAEDLKDYAESEQTEISNKNGELTQESSNVYSYSQNEALSGYGSQHNDESENNGDGDDESDEDDSIGQLEENTDQKENVEVENYDLDEEDSRINKPTAEKYTADDDYSQSDSQPIIVDQNLYNKYIALKDHLSGFEVNPQDGIEQTNQAYDVYQNYDDKVDIEEAYDYYEENNPAKFRDENNNFIDANGAYAVEQ